MERGLMQLDQPGQQAEEIILRLSNISKIYPGTVALQDVNLEIQKGEVHGIIGRNGAGKTTLVGIIAGLIKPSSGKIYIRNNSYNELSRIVAKRENIAIVPQEPQLFLEGTIAENLFMPEYKTIVGNMVLDWNRLYEETAVILKKGNLDLDPRSKVKDLGIGVQQILMILKASYVEKSDIIILDEASASMSENEEMKFYSIINERKCEGCTLLYISHRIDELLTVCDRMTVLRDGMTVDTVKNEDVNKASLSSLIVGHPITTRVSAVARQAKGSAKNTKENPTSVIPVIKIDMISKHNCFSEISFSVGKNEILGLAGLMGSGRTEILKTIYGMHPPDSGQILLNGEPFNINHPSRALQKGVAYLPEERDEEGLISNLSIKINLVISALERVAGRFFINRKKEDALVNELKEQLEIMYASENQAVKELSGGNRQKVVIAKVLSTQPILYLLDEPTKGIDVATKEKLLKIIREELAKDAAVIVTAPGLDELIEVCDRILVLYRGRLVGEYMRAEFDEETLYKAIQGVYIGVTEGIKPSEGCETFGQKY